jgi:hypothetical protein
VRGRVASCERDFFTGRSEDRKGARSESEQLGLALPPAKDRARVNGNLNGDSMSDLDVHSRFRVRDSVQKSRAPQAANPKISSSDLPIFL